MKSIQIKIKLLSDLFFSIIFLPILVILGPIKGWLLQWPVFFIIACAYMYACYFTITRINIPSLLIERKYRRIIVTMLSLVVVNYLLSCYPLPDMEFVIPSLSEYQTQVRNFGVAITLWLMFSLVMGYALTTTFINELYEQLLLKRKIEAQRDKAELAMFKAQISPHFLFNTLNSLYSLVIGTSEKAETAFIKFSDMLKYTYIMIEKDHVTLAEELEYINNFIDLQMIRVNQHTKVEWHHDVDNEMASIPPMLLMTFVENAFKYGSSCISDCVINISLELHNGELRFRTHNRIMKHSDEFRREVPIGIENSRARLQGLFPGKHSLTTAEIDGDFTLDLSIII